jgi:SAM-dependent methyltransferase
MTGSSLPGDSFPLPPCPSWLPNEGVLTEFYAETVRYPRYRNRVTEYIARLLPSDGPCSILDVGAGDGYLSVFLKTYRPNTRVVGVDVDRRRLSHSRSAVALYDGASLPFGDRSFDVALLTNVLHHADSMTDVLIETCRVARRRIIIKDHWSRGAWDRLRLGVLDVVGNLRFGASATGHYLDAAQWSALFSRAGCGRLRCYPELPFRAGFMAVLFANRLESLFSLEIDDRS